MQAPGERPHPVVARLQETREDERLAADLDRRQRLRLTRYCRRHTFEQRIAHRDRAPFIECVRQREHLLDAFRPSLVQDRLSDPPDHFAETCGRRRGAIDCQKGEELDLAASQASHDRGAEQTVVILLEQRSQQVECAPGL